ncbi:MAG: hypothetical protein BWY95_01715 [Bacteroidetes bacterium ADurb.BinA104]|nr:MAG: hypothetical protein BWY95_01715 [Bacteroidetes bacterium ADurb.BinA104]
MLVKLFIFITLWWIGDKLISAHGQHFVDVSRDDAIYAILLPHLCHLPLGFGDLGGGGDGFVAGVVFYLYLVGIV